jgi:hypothetical protein
MLSRAMEVQACNPGYIGGRDKIVGSRSAQAEVSETLSQKPGLVEAKIGELLSKAGPSWPRQKHDSLSEKQTQKVKGLGVWLK